jgi:hypothetical protein
MFHLGGVWLEVCEELLEEFVGLVEVSLVNLEVQKIEEVGNG